MWHCRFAVAQLELQSLGEIYGRSEKFVGAPKDLWAFSRICGRSRIPATIQHRMPKQARQKILPREKPLQSRSAAVF